MTFLLCLRSSKEEEEEIKRGRGSEGDGMQGDKDKMTTQETEGAGRCGRAGGRRERSKDGEEERAKSG